MPPPGPATPGDGDADVCAEALAHAGGHRLRHLGRDRAVPLELLGGDAELALLHVVRIRDDTSSKDVARARDLGQASRDEAAGARLRSRERQAPVAAEVEDDLRHRAPVLAEEVPAERGAERGGERLGPLSRLGIEDEIDVDLELACADRRLHPLSLPARVGERLRDRGLRRAEEAENRSPTLGRPLEDPRTGAVSSARGHRRRSSRGGPGQHDDDGAVRLEHEAGSSSRQAERERSLWQCRLLRDACRELVVRRPMRSANAREIASISRSRLSSTTSARPATRATISTVRSSWVGPRPPETRQRSAVNPSASARSRSSGRSPTMVIRSGSSPRRSASDARNGPLRSVRSPRTSSLPVTTTAARGRAFVKRGKR